jgi:hypothetical protein
LILKRFSLCWTLKAASFHSWRVFQTMQLEFGRSKRNVADHASMGIVDEVRTNIFLIVSVKPKLYWVPLQESLRWEIDLCKCQFGKSEIAAADAWFTSVNGHCFCYLIIF